MYGEVISSFLQVSVKGTSVKVSPFGLLHLAVDAHDGEVDFFEQAVELDGALGLGHEDDHLVELEGVEQVHQLAVLLLLRQLHEVLDQAVQRQLGAVDEHLERLQDGEEEKGVINSKRVGCRELTPNNNEAGSEKRGSINKEWSAAQSGTRGSKERERPPVPRKQNHRDFFTVDLKEPSASHCPVASLVCFQGVR